MHRRNASWVRGRSEPDDVALVTVERHGNRRGPSSPGHRRQRAGEPQGARSRCGPTRASTGCSRPAAPCRPGRSGGPSCSSSAPWRGRSRCPAPTLRARRSRRRAGRRPAGRRTGRGSGRDPGPRGRRTSPARGRARAPARRRPARASRPSACQSRPSTRARTVTAATRPTAYVVRRRRASESARVRSRSSSASTSGSRSGTRAVSAARSSSSASIADHPFHQDGAQPAARLEQVLLDRGR